VDTAKRKVARRIKRISIPPFVVHDTLRGFAEQSSAAKISIHGYREPIEPVIRWLEASLGIGSAQSHQRLRPIPPKSWLDSTGMSLGEGAPSRAPVSPAQAMKPRRISLTPKSHSQRLAEHGTKRGRRSGCLQLSVPGAQAFGGSSGNRAVELPDPTSDYRDPRLRDGIGQGHPVASAAIAA
jgi:hypothetical protein